MGKGPTVPGRQVTLVGRFRDAARALFGRHKVTEAAPEPAPAAVPRKGFEYGIPTTGLTATSAHATSAAQQDRQTMMTDLYDAFLACPWAWAAVNAIARTITGGGLAFHWDRDDGKGDEEAPDKPLGVLQCERLLKFCNPHEDLIQLIRSTLTDMLVFGDAYIEVVWAAGIPVALYTLDCPSTTPLADVHGAITGYIQRTEQGQEARFGPDEVIHISLDAPRSGIFGVSPTYAALLPIKTWLFTMATLKELFRKGLPPNIHVDHPAGMSDNDSRIWTDQYMSRNVGPLNIGRPIVTKGGGAVGELQQSRIDEILHVLDQQRDATIAAYGVPPSKVGIIESGNLGGGTGESQDKMFRVNTCHPLASIVLEKFNFVLTRAFGIEGWSLYFPEVDMRDSKVIEEIYDMRLRNGSWTLDRYRTEIGEPPVEGGDVPILIERQAIMRWRDIAPYSAAGVAQLAKGTNLEVVPPDPENEDAPLLLQSAAVAAPPTVPPDGQLDEPLPVESAWTRRSSRPLRESWATYSARVRQAMAELPEGVDEAA